MGIVNVTGSAQDLFGQNLSNDRRVGLSVALHTPEGDLSWDVFGVFSF